MFAYLHFFKQKYIFLNRLQCIISYGVLMRWPVFNIVVVIFAITVMLFVRNMLFAVESSFHWMWLCAYFNCRYSALSILSHFSCLPRWRCRTNGVFLDCLYTEQIFHFYMPAACVHYAQPTRIMMMMMKEAWDEFLTKFPS